MSYATSLAANPKYTSALMDLATAMPNLVSSIQQYEATAVQDPQAVTAVPAFVSNIPSQYRSIFESIYSAEMSIAVKDGILGTGAAATAEASATAAANGSGSGSSASSQATPAAGAASGSASASSQTTGSGASKPTGSSTSTSSGSASSSSASSSSKSAGNLRSESSLVVLAGGVLAGLLGTVFVL